MTITLCNSHPFTFYLPFHASLRADQCPIQSHVPSTCTLGLDPCARHSLFGRTDPYYIDNFYSSCGLKRLAATLASPLLCNCTVLPVPLSTGPYLGYVYAREVRCYKSINPVGKVGRPHHATRYGRNKTNAFLLLDCFIVKLLGFTRNGHLCVQPCIAMRRRTTDTLHISSVWFQQDFP